MIDLPPPMTPSDCDLRDFRYLPLEITRLFGSEFHSEASDAEWRAGVTIWLKSYHQVPAASMPDNDNALARAAEMGSAVRAWKKLRPMALRGWVKCSDGRLYHPVVAEKALEGWIEKLKARKSSAAGNAKRYKHAFDPAPHDAAIEAANGMLVRLNPGALLMKNRSAVGSEIVDDKPPGGSHQPPGGSANLPISSPASIPAGSQENGREEKKRELSSAVTDSAREASERTFQEICKMLCYNANDHANWVVFIELLTTHEVSHETILAAAHHHKRTGKPGNTMAYLRPKALELKSQATIVATAPMIFSDTDDEGWIERLRFFRKRGAKFWQDEWGPRPDQDGCKAPAQILQQFKFPKVAA